MSLVCYSMLFFFHYSLICPLFICGFFYWFCFCCCFSIQFNALPRSIFLCNHWVIVPQKKKKKKNRSRASEQKLIFITFFFLLFSLLNILVIPSPRWCFFIVISFACTNNFCAIVHRKTVYADDGMCTKYPKNEKYIKWNVYVGMKRERLKNAKMKKEVEKINKKKNDLYFPFLLSYSLCYYF